MPEKCVDALEVVVNQLYLYRNIAKALIKLPKSSGLDQTIQFYLSLIAYITRVINAFAGEVKEDGAKATSSQWRSAHLDFHIALMLHDSAFTPEHQAIALKDMRRTWTHFKAKKVYKKIQGRASAIATNYKYTRSFNFHYSNT